MQRDDDNLSPLLMKLLDRLQTSADAHTAAIVGFQKDIEEIRKDTHEVRRIVRGNNGEQSLAWRITVAETAIAKMDKARTESRSSQIKIWTAIIVAATSLGVTAIQVFFGS